MIYQNYNPSGITSQPGVFVPLRDRRTLCLVFRKKGLSDNFFPRRRTSSDWRDSGHTSSTSLANWSRRRPCDLEAPGVGLAYIVQGRRGRGRQAAVEDEKSNMRVLVLLAFVLGCNANLMLLPFPIAQQYRSQDLFGQTSFGHFSFDQNQQQTRLADGTVVGYYSYIGADGKPAVTIYEAGRQGFQVKGSNILPEAPEVPAAPELKAPEPVQETPEVLQARAEFQQKFDEATSTRRRREVQIPLPYFHPVPTVAKHKFETKQFEPVDANTPADTKKIELTTKEHEISVPAVKYVQPVVNVKPVTYTAASPLGLPYTFPFAHTFPFQTPFPFVPVKTA
ncbi:uncharacterized protein LOC119585506 [Penaeus monodon]|uniref:uncharacterized protein LOC119585506 n=1 Tax=Penaeus monodon TaxID=6687 RepID=UPI0018A780A6|nr:uncharacterized protein LOC119585506 [Penaeus monodon]